MKFSIVVSKKDIAGMNIKENLLELFDFSEKGNFQGNKIFGLKLENNNINVYTINNDSIVFETAEADIETDCFIFASRHQSKSGEKTLSIHFPGNFIESSEYGGKSRELCMAPAFLLKEGFKLLNDSEDIGYSITLEVTHHGPLIKKPVVFIEIGSKEEQWKDSKAGKIIAETIISMIKNYDPTKKFEVAIGFGGTHYCNSFNKIEAGEDIAISHICPKYFLENIDEAMIKKMINSTLEKVDYALLDWKGMLADDRNKIIVILDNLGIEWKKTKGLSAD